MKAVFRNVPAAVSLVCARVAQEFITDWCDDEGRGLYPHVNYDQGMSVDGTTVTIAGQRNALWAEHGEAMRALQEAKLLPLIYETSDWRLAWDETLWTYHQKSLALWGKYTATQAAAALSRQELRLLQAARAYFATKGVTE